LHALKQFFVIALLPFAALIGLAACAPVKVLNTVAEASKAFTEQEGVAYGPLARQQLDIYTPTAAAPTGGWPVVVFFYGGTWTSGERADYKFVGAALAARYPDFLRDSAQALAWGLTEAKRLGGNPDRVFAMGHSAGGYNAAMLALDARWLAGSHHAPTELAGWIGLAGAYDFLPSELPDVQKVFMHPNHPPKAQPIELERPTLLPAFLAAPVNDKVVSPTRSTLALAAKLKAAGAPVTLKMYERPTHATLVGAFAAPLRWVAPVLEDVSAFIEATPPAKMPA
jgi:acetyl esterase/lipase